VKVEEVDVHPVSFALQGHPEYVSLWAEKVKSFIMCYLRFTTMVHEPCMYIGVCAEQPMMIGRQVDDFKVAAQSVETSRTLITFLQPKITIEAEEGIMSPREYIKMAGRLHLQQSHA
jgi:hypothetical protein